MRMGKGLWIRMSSAYGIQAAGRYERMPIVGGEYLGPWGLAFFDIVFVGEYRDDAFMSFKDARGVKIPKL